MSTFVFDTNILLGYIVGAPYAAYVRQQYEPNTPPNLTVISVVSIGEIYSLAYQRNWGAKKRRQLHDLLDRIPAQPIYDDAIIERYAEIDAFSQGKLRPVAFTARNMGKNDLWIAATASVLSATLLTTDGDFDHLDGEYLTVVKIDPKQQPDAE